MRKNNGFSFIEIAVVLSIVGLVLAAIMTGNYMLEAARLNSMITDVARIKGALEGFQSKYRSLPGDMPDAASFWSANCVNFVGGVTNPCNGNGNGRIEYNITGGSEQFEDIRAWQHLGLSGYYVGDYSGAVEGNRFVLGVNAPESQRSGVGYWIKRPAGTTRYYDTTGNLVMLGRVNPANGLLDAAALTVQEAHSLDLKVDDGLPDSGAVFAGRGSGEGNNRCTNGDAPVGNFTQNSASFRFSDTETSCVMMFWFNKD